MKLSVKIAQEEKQVETDLLKAQLSVLMVQNVISYKSDLCIVQQALLSRFDVQYKVSDIEAELFDMMYQDEIDARYFSNEEDFYQG
jgi:hypothetical protein